MHIALEIAAPPPNTEAAPKPADAKDPIAPKIFWTSQIEAAEILRDIKGDQVVGCKKIDEMCTPKKFKRIQVCKS